MNKNNLTPFQNFDIDRQKRAEIKKQKPKCIWLTGLSGSGKSTIANALDKDFTESGLHSYILDGDNIRNTLCSDLSFTDQDRHENIRRVAEVSKLMFDAGLIVICALISPFIKDRAFARSLFNAGDFIEVFVNTPIDVIINRDPKGHYKNAQRGLIENFTGFDSEYQIPEKPEVVIETNLISIDESILKIKEFIDK